MIVDESKYSWAAWKQPKMTSNTTWGIVSATYSNNGHEPYLALDNNMNTQWENKDEIFPTDFIWEFEKPLKISAIKLTNKKSSYGYVSKTVKVYAEKEKSTLLQTQVFNKQSQSVVNITFEQPISMDMIVFEFPDTYGTFCGLSEVLITAEVGEKIPEVNPEWRYLISDKQNKFYTYSATDGLTELAISTLDAASFEASGFQGIPPSDILKTLVNPTVLCWQKSQDTIPALAAQVTAIPPVQAVYSKNYTLPDKASGIESIIVDASNDVLFALSFDGGTSWKMLSGSTWIDADTSAGMTKSEIEAITADTWNSATTQRQYKIRFLLTENSYCKKISVTYLVS